MADADGNWRLAWNERIRGYVREWRELIASDPDSDSLAIRPQRLWNEIGRNLPEEVILWILPLALSSELRSGGFAEVFSRLLHRLENLHVGFSRGVL